MVERGIVAVDEGTTGTRAMAIAENGTVRARTYRRLEIVHPQPGWVEQDASALWERTREALADLFAQLAGRFEVVALAITNQRETTVAWDRRTGRPLHPAIVWQCRRTAAHCQSLIEQGAQPWVRNRTGLPLDPYFSASKMAWLLEHAPEARSLAARGQLALGTVDSWLLYHLTGGAVHATDMTNASRTQLLDLRLLRWDEPLCDLFGVPIEALPALRPSGGECGRTALVSGVPDGLPIMAIIGDSQAALFGEAAFDPGAAKVTYGTGSSVLINAGREPPVSSAGLASTLAWQLGGETTYALDGIVHTTGGAIEWLRELGLVKDAAATEALATSVDDTGGVWFVPALSGLGTPWWDPSARGLLIGLTAATRREHVVRAALDAIALQVCDVCAALPAGLDAGAPLFAGGGGSRNAYLMQRQADLLGRVVVTSRETETSAFGAAFVAGLTAGLWTLDDVITLRRQAMAMRFEPRLPRAEAARVLHDWHRAVERAVHWVEGESAGGAGASASPTEQRL